MFMSPLVAAHKVLALNWKADVASSFSVGRIAWCQLRVSAETERVLPKDARHSQPGEKGIPGALLTFCSWLHCGWWWGLLYQLSLPLSSPPYPAVRSSRSISEWTCSLEHIPWLYPSSFSATIRTLGQLGVEARCKEFEVRGLDLNFVLPLTSWETLGKLCHLFAL